MGPQVPFASGGYEGGCVLNSLRKGSAPGICRPQDPAIGIEPPAGRQPQLPTLGPRCGAVSASDRGRRRRVLGCAGEAQPLLLQEGLDDRMR